MMEFLVYADGQDADRLKTECDGRRTFWKGNTVVCAALVSKKCIIESNDPYSLSPDCLEAIRMYYPGHFNFYAFMSDLQLTRRWQRIIKLNELVETKSYQFFTRLLLLKKMSWDAGRSLKKELASYINFGTMPSYANSIGAGVTARWFALGPYSVRKYVEQLTVGVGFSSDTENDTTVVKRQILSAEISSGWKALCDLDKATTDSSLAVTCLGLVLSKRSAPDHERHP
jgi:hypothetical protein